MNNLYFIAELGQNHQGSLKIAQKMVDALEGSGISAIKTAKRDIDTCLTEEQKNMIYDNPNSFGRTYYEHRKALELSHSDFEELKYYIEGKGFDFIPSYTDIPSFDFIKKLGCKKIKIASQRITDYELLNHTAENFDGDVYMSSGMSTFEDIDNMIDIFKNNDKFLLQCTSVYPCPDDIIDLRVLKKYRKRYKKVIKKFGFSGHNMSIAPDIAAFTLGARIIERHFTLDRQMKGTDHPGSLELYSIMKLIKYLKQTAQALGDSEKKIQVAEYPAIEKLRGDLK